MDANGFKDLIKPIADAVAGHSVEAALGEMLNQEFPPDGEAFKASDFAREAFGSEVVDHYVHHLENERAAYERAVTDWERERYFEQI